MVIALVAVVFTGVMTAIIAFAVKPLGWRVTKEDEDTGLFCVGDWSLIVVLIIIAFVAMAFSAFITTIIAFALEKTVGCGVTSEQEVSGFDLGDQGELAYDFAGSERSFIREMK